MTSTADSATWIASVEGLYHFQYHKTLGQQFIKVDELPANLTSIEYETYSKTPYLNEWGVPIDDSAEIKIVLWGGTANNGIVRMSAYKVLNRNGVVSDIGMDSISYLTEEDGLLSNTINYLDMDRTNGYLWMATNKGISRYNIGHSFEKLENNRSIVAYPNPYVKSRHKRIVFENLTPGSSISVYTVDGKLVAHIVDKGSNVVKTTNEWTYIWWPDERLIPGMYFYTAKKQQIYERTTDKSVIGKFLILP